VKAGTRRVVAAVVLAAFVIPTLWLGFYGPRGFGFYLLYQLRWPLIMLAAMIAAAVWQRRRAPPPPRVNPRPKHLKIVRSDETLH
jgi:hypothetical protein